MGTEQDRIERLRKEGWTKDNILARIQKWHPEALKLVSDDEAERFAKSLVAMVREQASAVYHDAVAELRAEAKAVRDELASLRRAKAEEWKPDVIEAELARMAIAEAARERDYQATIAGLREASPAAYLAYEQIQFVKEQLEAGRIDATQAVRSISNMVAGACGYIVQHGGGTWDGGKWKPSKMAQQSTEAGDIRPFVGAKRGKFTVKA